LFYKGIEPSKTAKYDLNDIESALHAKLSFSFVLECKHQQQSWNVDEYELLRVKICVSGNGKNIISCPISKETSCGSKVKFPPFTSDMLSENVIDKRNHIKMPFEKVQVA
jgi:Ribonuclease T2 family